MKNNVIRWFCIAVLQLVIVVLLWPVVMIERALTWLLGRLDVRLCRSARSVLGDIVARREAHKDTDEALKPTPLSSNPVHNRISNPKPIHIKLAFPPSLHYATVWPLIERCRDNCIAAFRQYVETEWGIPEWARKDNPRLYAVLLPNRQENLERLSYALCNVPRDQLYNWFAKMAAALR